MKLTLFYFLVFFQASSLIYGQNSIDSILNNQVEAIDNLSGQIRRIRKELETYNSTTLSEGNSLSDSIAAVNKRFLDLQSNYSSIEEKLGSQKIENESPPQNLWQRSGPQIIGAFIGTFTGILVFLLGFVRERSKEGKKKKKEHKEKIHYLSSLVRSNINLSRKYIESLREFCNKIKDKPMELPLVPINPTQDFKRLSKTFDKEDYYHAFLDEFGDRTENVNKFRILANDADFILKQFEQILDMQSRAKEFETERKRNYAILLEKVRDEILRVGESYRDSNRNFSAFILSVISSNDAGLNDDNRTKLEYFENSFVVPIKRGLIQIYSGLQESSYFIQKLKRLTAIYEEIPLQNKAHAKNYEDIFIVLEEVIDRLEKEGREVLAKLSEDKKQS